MADGRGRAVKPSWEATDLIANRLKLNRRSVGNVIKLLDDGATIPFIARYRKEQTDNMEPDMLREVAAGVEELRSVESKIQSIHNTIQKMGKMTVDLDTSLKASTSILEVDSLYAPFKPGHKGTYAERARTLGLEPLAQDLLNSKRVNFIGSVNPSTKGLQTVGDIQTGVKHIIADIIAKDKEAMDTARNICERCAVMIESVKAKGKAAEDKNKTAGRHKNNKEDSSHKFEQYFDFKVWVKSAKPHQILALNRGEDLKYLNVKISIPCQAKTLFVNFALQKFVSRVFLQENCALIRLAISDAYDRLIEPMLCRHIRSDLTKEAEKASIGVFTSNLKGLLLTPPVKNKTILGIDPGFRNGCKVAVISATGQVLSTDIIYLHNAASLAVETHKIASLVNDNRCEIITIGNGVACRETEQIISKMITQGSFHSKDIVYCIVDECGASIYSVSAEAQSELPKLDPSLRGAVSIARRLQDPLAEMVKIEPQHLGVGMYQHDVNKTKLQNALGSVVEECVSFVGVDLNTCSECLLRHVAGMNATKAKNIMKWRTKHGHFTNREQLLSIKGLGQKSFEQCAGFVRIAKPGGITEEVNRVSEDEDSDVIIVAVEEVRETRGRKRGAQTAGPSQAKKSKTANGEDWNPLDATAIHPESYDLAYKLAKYIGVDLKDIGKADFIDKVKRRTEEQSMKVFSDQNNAGLATVQLITQALKQPLSYDLRESFQKPIFKKEVMSLADLRVGTELTGRVTNVTHFGAFVDIGVGQNGLIHSSKMGSCGRVSVGDNVEVKVENLDLNRMRIGLFLKNILLR